MVSDNLPPSWTNVRLGDVVTSTKGKKPKRLLSEAKKGFLPYIDIEAFEKRIINRFGDEESARVGSKDDVLIVWDGARSGLVGKMDRVGAIGSTIAILNPISETINREYLFQYLQSQYETVNKNARGTGIPHVDPEIFWNLNFPVAPNAEQKRIVAKLEKLLTKVNDAKERLETIPRILKRFRQSVLAAACFGRLTADWRKNNPSEKSANDLLLLIANRRRENYEVALKDCLQQGNRRPRKVFSDKLPIIQSLSVDLPETWAVTNVNFLAHVTKLAGFEYTKYIKFSDEGEIPVVRAQNVQMGKFVPENLKYITKKTSDLLERSKLHGREILMVFIGAGTGNVCMAPKERSWHLAPNVAKIDVDGINSNYLFLYLQSPVGFDYTSSWIKATAQPSLSMETIRKILVFLPPLAEQNEIVRRVERLFKLADTIEVRYAKAKKFVDKLTQSILAKAFRGELVPQDPSDEPEAVLLDKIRKEKSSNAGKLKKARVSI